MSCETDAGGTFHAVQLENEEQSAAQIEERQINVVHDTVPIPKVEDHDFRPSPIEKKRDEALRK